MHTDTEDLHVPKGFPCMALIHLSTKPANLSFVQYLTRFPHTDTYKVQLEFTSIRADAIHALRGCNFLGLDLLSCLTASSCPKADKAARSFNDNPVNKTHFLILLAVTSTTT